MALQALDEEALATLLKGVEEHKAAAENLFPDDAAKDAAPRRGRAKSGAPARRRAASRDSSDAEEVNGISLCLYNRL